MPKLHFDEKAAATADGIKSMLGQLVATVNEINEANAKYHEEAQAKDDLLGEQREKLADLETKAKAGENVSTELEETKAKMNELLDEISDLRSKFRQPNLAVTGEQKQAMHEAVIKPVIGQWVKGKSNGTASEFFKFINTEGAEQFKTLNITNADEGGRAVAEVLSRDLIEYAREFSPILSQVGRKPSMTRNFRELVLVSYPGTRKGIEHVAGTATTETSTQEYKEVKSKVFKVEAEPRITDEAMYGADMDLYGDLIRLLGTEIGIYLAAQVLYGDGSDKSARGILSSQRIDITDGTGESWKPTLATDPANARSADFYPVIGTGVSGSLGADDMAVVDLIIDVTNTLPTRWLNGSAWHMNRKTKGVLEKIRTADDKPVLIESYMSGGQPLLRGYPVVIDDTLPDIAADSTPIIFGRLDQAYAINDGDIDKMLLNPYKVTGCTLVEYAKEMFEMIQNSDAIIVISCTTNDGTV